MDTDRTHRNPTATPRLPISVEKLTAAALQYPEVQEAIGDALASDLVTANVFLRLISEHARDFYQEHGSLPREGDWTLWLNALPEKQRDGVSEQYGRLLVCDLADYTPAELIKAARSVVRREATLTVRSRLEAFGDDVDPESLEELTRRVRELGTESAWPETPILPSAAEPEPLPLDALPSVLREQVESVAGATQTPTDMATLMALAAVSAATRGIVDVWVDDRGWIEPVTIYAACLLPPATRKSAVVAHMRAPISNWERTQREGARPERRSAQALVEMASIAYRRLVQAAGSTEIEVQDAREKLARLEAKVPPEPRYLVSDATPEALQQVMGEQGGAIAVLDPEADVLGLVDGRYSDDARVDLLLRAWSGEPLQPLRIGRETIEVPRAVLTLGLAIQPQAIRSLRHGQTLRGRGLWGRILWALPPHGLGARRTGRDVPALDTGAAKRYERAIERLLAAAEKSVSDRILSVTIAGDGASHDVGSDKGNSVNSVSGGRDRARQVLTLSSEALDLLYDYEAELEADLGEGGRLETVGDWAGKAHGHAVRLAALLELVERAGDPDRDVWEGSIGESAMSGAIRLMRALTSHALAILDEGGLDDSAEDLRYVLRTASELPADQNTLRDLHRAVQHRPGLHTVHQLRSAVSDLEDRGCLRLRKVSHSGPGRTPSPVVLVHPALAGNHMTEMTEPAEPVVAASDKTAPSESDRIDSVPDRMDRADDLAARVWEKRERLARERRLEAVR